MPAGLAIVLALGFCGLFTALAVLIGPKATNPEKLKPFECGSEPIGSPRGRYSVKFYQVAILFLVFDMAYSSRSAATSSSRLVRSWL